MRKRLLLPAFLLFCLHAAAQVTVDPRALDPLQPPRPAAGKPAAPAAAKPPSPPAPTKPAAAPSGVTIRPNPGPAAGAPAIPTAAPPAITLPPPIAVPTRPTPPAAPATVAADAPGSATVMPGGLRVTFGPGRADLNPTTEAAIRTLVRGGPSMPPAPEASSFTITSFASGTPEDPSTARRLSLSRALTARSVLITQGIPSVRIYVKALGPNSPGFPDGPADRADIIVASNPLPATPPTAAAAKPR